MQSCSSIAKADDEWPSQTDPPLCPSVGTVVVAVVVVVVGGGGGVLAAVVRSKPGGNSSFFVLFPVYFSLFFFFFMWTPALNSFGCSGVTIFFGKNIFTFFSGVCGWDHGWTAHFVFPLLCMGAKWCGPTSSRTRTPSASPCHVKEPLQHKNLHTWAKKPCAIRPKYVGFLEKSFEKTANLELMCEFLNCTEHY